MFHIGKINRNEIPTERQKKWGKSKKNSRINRSPPRRFLHNKPIVCVNQIFIGTRKKRFPHYHTLTDPMEAQKKIKQLSKLKIVCLSQIKISVRCWWHFFAEVLNWWTKLKVICLSHIKISVEWTPDIWINTRLKNYSITQTSAIVSGFYYTWSHYKT